MMVSIGAKADQVLEAKIENIKVGMTQDKVLEIAGEPQWRCKTFLNDVQWDYVLPENAKSTVENKERKIWIVYDSKGEVKEVWRYRACHLGLELQNRKQAEQGGADQPATALEPKPEGNSKPKPESEGRSQ